MDSPFKNNMKRITLLFLIFILCSFSNRKDKKLYFVQTEFSKTCIQLSNDLKKSGHSELISKSDGKYIEAIDFSKILLRISKYDLSKEDKYELEKVESVKSSKLIWKIKNPKNIKRLEKLTFKAISGPGITIIDYNVYRITKPNHIHLRVLEGEFEELTIDKMKYSEFFESRLVGADEALDELRELEKQ